MERSALIKIFVFTFGLIVSGFVVGDKRNTKIVRKMRVRSNINLEREVILETLGVKKGLSLPSEWPEKYFEKLLSLYHKQGYYMARIDSMKIIFSHDSMFVDLELWLREGKQVRVGDIEITGSVEFDQSEFIRLMETKNGRVFNEEVLEQDINQILIFLENNGHPLGHVEISSIMLQQQRKHPEVDVIINIVEGPEVTLESIRMKGNNLTKYKVIKRETRLKEGSLYKHGDVLASIENLQRLGYFLEVAEPEVVFVQNRAIVTYKIKEGNSNTINGILGYNPPKLESIKGYFTGQLQFTFRNLLGMGRFLEAFWEKKDEYSQAIRFKYEEPWLFNEPVNAGVRFFQEIRDTTYVERDWRFSIKYVPWSYFSINIESGQKEILPDSLGSVRFNLAQTKSWLFSAGIDYNTLDDPVNPRKGVRYHTTFTWGKKQNVGPDFLIKQKGWKHSISSRLINIDAEAVIPTIGQQIIYIGLHGTEVKTGDQFIPLSDQIRFGGAKSMRGYTEDAFRGNLVAWINCEYRYLLSRRSRVFIFVDGGIYQRREELSGLVKGAKIGYGFGIRLETRLGLIGIDYGLGEGDSLMRGKVHVGLVNQF